MKVVLLERVENLGAIGDVVTVKDGYARNYLVPRGLATAWSKGAESEVNAIRKARKAREIASLEDARAIRDSLQSKAVVVKAEAGNGGRLFGAVTTADIAAAVEASVAQKIDRRKVEIGQPIKSTGDFTVSLRLHPEVSANIKLKVVAA